MKIQDLRGICQGQSATMIDMSIKATDEYQLAAQSGDQTEIHAVYAAALLFLRGDVDTGQEALLRAFTQRLTVFGALKDLVGPKVNLTWVPSGSLAGRLFLDIDNDFVEMLEGGVFNPNKSTTRLNCWEAVLLSAMLGGALKNATKLSQIYNDSWANFEALLVKAMVSGSGRPYLPADPLSRPALGDIVLFDGLGHVAVAVGYNGAETEILSFWPAPWVAKFGPGTVTVMAETTIEEILRWQKKYQHNSNVGVTFGSPDWAMLDES